MRLADCILFQGLLDPASTARRLHATHCSYGDGDVIAAQGSPADRLWVIESGMLRVHAVLGDQSHLITYRRPGDLVGEQGILQDDSCRTATLTASGPVTAHAIEAAALRDLPLPEQMQIWHNMARILSGKLAEATARRAALLSADTTSRGMLRKLTNPHVLSAMTCDEVPDAISDIRVITWFSDLVGFSKYAEGAPAPEVAGLIRAANQAQSDLITKADGFVDKFIGDAVMAYWVVRTDTARERAAAALDAARHSLRTVRGIAATGYRPELRIGLHIGAAKCGNFGSQDRVAWTLIGDDVNLGARYEQAHETVDGRPLGALRISPDLASLLPAEAVADWPKGIASVKGRTFPVLSGE